MTEESSINTTDRGGHLDERFGNHAKEYLTSPVFSSGTDLDRISRLMKEYPRAEVLDLGCGAGHVSYLAAPGSKRVTAYDISRDMLALVEEEAARRELGNIEVVQGLVQELPFAGSAFDVVISRHSAHHWLEMPQSMQEIRRVLRASGALLLIDVISPGLPALDVFLQSVEMLRDPTHIRYYSAGTWLRFVSNASLRVDKMKTMRLRLDFSSWTSRAGTPEHFRVAIRELQKAVTPDVRDYFQVEKDGSFTVDVIILEARKI